MQQRPYWQQLIHEALERRPIIWLSGVRRSGKTTLCQSLPEVEYLDCELPSVRRRLEDPEAFFRSLAVKRKKRLLVLDEVHRLPDPSEALKIAADHFSDSLRVIGTGSSTLGASKKFSDTLTGRKTNLWLTPAIDADSAALGLVSLDHRMKAGGLPPFYLSPSTREQDFQEWLESFWAKDVLELFRLERRASFMKFAEMLLTQSGGIFEASSFAAPCEVSRTTIANYLAVLGETYVAHVLRPFHARKPTEIVSAPKVYGFDTGFVAQFKGIDSLRPNDRGDLWEHLVLNELHGHLQRRDTIHYWRDKQHHEIDFVVLPGRGKHPVAIEAKFKAREFNPRNLAVFRRLHPKGANYVVGADVETPQEKVVDGLSIRFVGLRHIGKEILTLGR